MYVDLSTKLFTFNVKFYWTLHTHTASQLSNKVIKELKTATLRTTCTWDYNPLQ